MCAVCESCTKWFGSTFGALRNWFNALWLVRKTGERRERFRKYMTKRLPGWQLGVAAVILLAVLTLLGNVIFLAVAVRRDKWRANGLGTLVEDECDKIDNYNKAAHIFINVISTLRSSWTRER